jgi:hypothetical protein
MTLRKRILTVILTVAFIAFVILLTGVIVRALLQTTVDIQTTGHIGPYSAMFPSGSI